RRCRRAAGVAAPRWSLAELSGGDAYAAVTAGGGDELDGARPLGRAIRHPAQERDVGVADDLAVIRGEPVERAVGEREAAGAVVVGLVAAGLQRGIQRPGGGPELAAGLLGDRREYLANGPSGAVGLLDGGREQLTGELVTAGRDG